MFERHMEIEKKGTDPKKYQKKLKKERKKKRRERKEKRRDKKDKTRPDQHFRVTYYRSKALYPLREVLS